MVGLVAFMLLTSRSQKKREKREREDMYSKLTKNDPRLEQLPTGGRFGRRRGVIDDIIDVAPNGKVLSANGGAGNG